MEFLNVCNLENMSKPRLDDIASGQVVYRSIGEGEPLLMLMGGHSTMHAWDPYLVRGLAQYFKVYLFEYPNISYSESSHPFDVAGLAKFTEEFAAMLKLKKYSLFGHGMGGWIAQELALSQPQKIERLMLASTDCGGTKAVRCSTEVREIFTDTESSALELAPKLFRLMIPESKLAEFRPKFQAIMTCVGEQAPVTDLLIELEKELFEQWYSDKGGVFERLSQLTMPVLIFHGEQDEVMPFANADILANHIKGAKLQSFADTAYGVLYQQPQAVLAEIIRYFALDEAN